MTAGYQNDMPVIRRCQYLMRENARIDSWRLLDLGAERCVGVDPVNSDLGRIVECDQHMLRRNVGCHVNGAMRQRDRRAMRAKRARCGVDPERAHMMVGARDTHARGTVTAGNIKKSAGCVRPDVL